MNKIKKQVSSDGIIWLIGLAIIAAVFLYAFWLLIQSDAEKDVSRPLTQAAQSVGVL